MVGRRKDKDKDKDSTTSELAKELEGLALEDQEGLLALIRMRKGSDVTPDESSKGGNGKFREPTAKEASPIVPEQVKINIAQMLGKLTPDLSNTILTSRVPNDILISSAIMKTRAERQSPDYRKLHPNETFNVTLLKNIYLHLMAHRGGRIDELLRIAELETDRGHEGNIPLSYGQ